MSDNRTRDRRRIIGLIDPEHQLRFAFYLIGGGITALMLICLYVLVRLENNIRAVLESGQVPGDISDALLDHVGRAELTVTAVSLALMVVSVILGLRLSHRIYGPMVRFRRHITSLTQGDYSSRVQLRENDQFYDLADDLNVLAEKLQKR